MLLDWHPKCAGLVLGFEMAAILARPRKLKAVIVSWIDPVLFNGRANSFWRFILLKYGS